MLKKKLDTWLYVLFSLWYDYKYRAISWRYTHGVEGMLITNHNDRYNYWTLVTEACVCIQDPYRSMIWLYFADGERLTLRFPHIPLVTARNPGDRFVWTSSRTNTFDPYKYLYRWMKENVERHPQRFPKVYSTLVDTLLEAQSHRAKHTK